MGRHMVLVILLASMLLSPGVMWAETGTGAGDGTGDGVLTLARRFLGMGTGSIEGTYYPLGTAMAGLFNSRLEGMVALAEPTAGSIANLEYLNLGDLALALAQSDMVYDAFHGKGRFSGRPTPRLRVLASLYPEAVHLVVRRAAAGATIRDLRGKNIAVGEEGSGTALNARRILATSGLTEADYQARYLSYTKATEALSSGDIDAVFFTGGVPSDGLIRLASKTPVTILEIPEETCTRLIAAEPFWGKETIPADTYPGQPLAVRTVGLRALFVANEDLPHDVATQMLELLFSNLSYLSEKTPAARSISRARALDGIDPAMLHPAATAFFGPKP